MRKIVLKVLNGGYLKLTICLEGFVIFYKTHQTKNAGTALHNLNLVYIFIIKPTN